MNTAPVNTPLHKLTLALDEAYQVFSIYPQPERLEGSPLKDVDGILRDITSEPLRKLPANKLSHFAFSSVWTRSEEHTSELQSRQYLVCRLLLEKKKTDT